MLYGDTQEGPFYHELLDAQTDIQSIRPYLMFGKALCQAQSDTMNQHVKQSEVAA